VKTKAKPVLDELWMSTEACSHLIEVSPSHFRASIAPKLGPEHVRRDPKIRYFAPAVVKASKAAVAASLKVKPLGEDADLWSDFDSPNLERLRAAKADQAEMDVAVRMGRLISVDDLKERLGWLFSRLRQYGDLLQRQFGRDAAIHHNEFMDDLKGFDVESIASARSA
jgi:hypothetical protein